MNNWAYARAVIQHPGALMPNAFLAYFLPTWHGRRVASAQELFA
jgi:hypothetical protein